LLSRWPSATFRIYISRSRSDVTVRFHKVRPELANWAAVCDEIIEVGPPPGEPCRLSKASGRA
jgi:hypothetical protein